MAEELSLTKIEDNIVKFKDFSADGKVVEYNAPMPTDLNMEKWSLMQQVMMLKNGMWDKLSIFDITWGLLYARKRGADVTQGDIFPTGKGRFGESNAFRRKMALRTGNVLSISTELKYLDDPLPVSCAKCVSKKDIECTATVEVKGWSKPIIKTQRLSRWFNDKNPNWVNNPENMLEESTVGHACRWVPGVDDSAAEEAPPDVAPVQTQGLAATLRGRSEQHGTYTGQDEAHERMPGESLVSILGASLAQAQK